MNGTLWFLAFVVMPIVVVAVGYGALWLHERDLDKRYKAKLGE